MAKKIVIPGPDGKPVEAELVDVVKAEEVWSRYTLSDGNVIRLKPTVLQVAKVKDMYAIQAKNILVREKKDDAI